MRKVLGSIAGILIAAAFNGLYAQNSQPACPVPPATEEKPWLNTRYTPNCRAQFVLNRLKTLDDKFAWLAAGGGGGRGAAAPAIDFGLTRGGASDGPAGVARGTGVTAFPTPLSVAATFDTAM